MRSWRVGWRGWACPADAEPTDAARIGRIGLLERLKAAAAARQADLMAALDASQRAAQKAAGVRAAKLGCGIGAQIGLARRDSAQMGSQHFGLVLVLTEMPRTLAALWRGDTCEWRATVMAREPACVSREDRRAVDVVGGPQLGQWGNRETERQGAGGGVSAGPGCAGASARARRIRAARVTMRPAPESMTYLTGLLPVKHGVAAHTALKPHAERCRAHGDQRSEGQIMADELIARVTGTRAADGPDAEIVVVVVNGDTLFAGPTHQTTTDQAAASAADGTAPMARRRQPTALLRPRPARIWPTSPGSFPALGRCRPGGSGSWPATARPGCGCGVRSPTPPPGG